MIVIERFLENGLSIGGGDEKEMPYSTGIPGGWTTPANFENGFTSGLPLVLVDSC